MATDIISVDNYVTDAANDITAGIGMANGIITVGDDIINSISMTHDISSKMGVASDVNARVS